MICWVVERALAAKRVARAIVATDDERIRDAVMSAGYEAIMTSPNHESGTDRVAEVAEGLKDTAIIVNIQGDEPMISPLTIDRAVDEMASGDAGIVTTWEPVDSVDSVVNPAVVKVVLDETGRAVYFSRSPVPYPRDFVRKHGTLDEALHREPALLSTFRKHTGLYVYRREVLLEFTKWPQAKLERTEALEQLRALAHGVEIKAIEASSRSIGVDTAEDLERVRSIVEEEARGLESRLQLASLPSSNLKVVL